MALYVVGSSYAKGAKYGNDVTISRPASYSVGDMFLAFLVNVGNSYTTVLPSGWSLYESYLISSGGSRQVNIAYKIAGSSEPSSYTFYNVGGTPGRAMGYIAVIHSTISTPTIDKRVRTSGSSGSYNVYSIAAPTITTSYAHELVFTWAGYMNSIGAWTYHPSLYLTYPTGTNELYNSHAPDDWWSDIYTGIYYYWQWGVAFYAKSTAGATGTKTWNWNDGTSNWAAYQIAIYDTTGIPSCTCNSICDSDCSVNQLCSGHENACSNSYSFTSVSSSTIITASHVTQLQTAINNERTNSSRRYNSSEPANCGSHTTGNVACSSNDWSSYSFTSVAAGTTITAAQFTQLKTANNQIVSDSGYGTSVTQTYSVGGVIYASHVTDLQSKINQTRNACICDSHCNCNPADCGCNGECPSDDYGEYYS